MTITENAFVKIMVDARAIQLTPNLDAAVGAAAERIATAANEALTVKPRKPREPKAESAKKGAAAK